MEEKIKLSESEKEYNKKIKNVYEMEEYFLSESSTYDERYYARLRVLALYEKNEEAIYDYEKIKEIKGLSDEEKKKLLSIDENGKINLQKYNLSVHANIYVLSHISKYAGLKKLFKLENKDGKKDFLINRLGIEDKELVRILKDERNKYLRNALFLEKIKDENGEERIAINYLFSKIEDIKKVLCESKIPNIEILSNIIKGAYGEFGKETVDLVLINANRRMLEELLKKEEIFDGKEETREEIQRRLKILKKLMNPKEKIENYKELKIPYGMTIGVELEMLGSSSYYLYGNLIEDYKGKQDITVQDGYYNGVEIVSPKLSNGNINTLFGMIDNLNELGQYTDKSCGGHIHVGADYLTITDEKNNLDIISTKLAWKALLEIWENTEEIMYKITNKEGEEFRGLKYVKPLSDKIEEMLKEMKINKTEYLQEFLSKIKEIQIEGEPILSQRNFSINFSNLNNSEKNTIEFRLPNGTLEKQEIKNNINLVTKIISVSRKIGIIEGKMLKNKELSQEEKRIIEAYRENNRDKDITEKEKLENLLNLLFEEDNEKAVYLKRYEKSKFNLKEEKAKLEDKKTPDYRTYGDDLTEEELKYLNLIRKNVNIKFNKKEFEETSKEIENEKPNAFKRVLNDIKRFTHRIISRISRNHDNENIDFL